MTADCLSLEWSLTMTEPAARTPEQEIAGLKLEVKALKKALGTLIAWLPQSANSPIRVDEASTLLNMMNGHEP
jgi:hypothetical protein